MTFTKPIIQTDPLYPNLLWELSAARRQARLLLISDGGESAGRALQFVSIASTFNIRVSLSLAPSQAVAIKPILTDAADLLLEAPTRLDIESADAVHIGPTAMGTLAPELFESARALAFSGEAAALYCKNNLPVGIASPIVLLDTARLGLLTGAPVKEVATRPIQYLAEVAAKVTAVLVLLTENEIMVGSGATLIVTHLPERPDENQFGALLSVVRCRAADPLAAAVTAAYLYRAADRASFADSIKKLLP